MASNDNDGCGCLLVFLALMLISLVIAYPWVFLFLAIAGGVIAILIFWRSRVKAKHQKLMQNEAEERQRIEREAALERQRLEHEAYLEIQRIDKERQRIEQQAALERQRLEQIATIEQERLDREKRALEAVLAANALLKSRISEVDRMSGIEFEEYLACLYTRLGYTVQLTPASNDYGADLILDSGMRKIVVQAKRYMKPITNSAVQEVHGALGYYGADEAWVVTSSTFTANAVELANSLRVTLVDRHSLIELTEQVRSEGANECND